MEFWGVEVPAGKPTVCQPGENFYLHVSQAALGESKDKTGKGNERVVLRVQVDENEVVLGTLSQGKCDQMSLDLVFDRDFKITHNSTTSSVFICGYKTEGPDEFVGFNTYYDSEEDEDEDEDEEEGNEAPVPVAVPIKENGDASVKVSKAAKSEKSGKPVSSLTEKAASAAAKAITEGLQKAMQNKAEEDDDEDDEEEGMEGTVRGFVDDIAEESFDEFDDGSDEDMDDEEDEGDDEDEMDDDFDSDESDEEELKIETPKSGKKRAAVAKESGSEKKSKLDASSKSGGLGQAPVSAKKEKKSGSVTPAGKTSGNAKEAKTPKTPTDNGLQKSSKTPKGTPATPTTPSSDKKLGQYKCTGCDKNFTTESALSQHSAAKHKK